MNRDALQLQKRIMKIFKQAMENPGSLTEILTEYRANFLVHRSRSYRHNVLVSLAEALCGDNYSYKVYESLGGEINVIVSVRR